MPKIVLNSNILWTITQFRLDLIFELKKTYELYIVSSIDDFSDAPMQIIKDLGIPFYQVNLDRKGLNPIDDLSYFISLLRLYKKIKPDLIIHYTIKPNIYGSLAANILKIKTFAVISGLGSVFIQDGLTARIAVLLYRLALKKPERVFFLNNDDMNEFVERKIVDTDKAVIMPGEGINVDLYRLPNNALKKTSGRKSFLMLARLLKDKGVYEYIDAARKLSDLADFFLAGVLDGDNPSAIKKEELESWVDDGFIVYLGKSDNVMEFFKIADVVVLPSYREGLSRVLLEACSCEKPIITSNIAGCKELCIDGKNGYLCEAKNSLSLESAIIKMIHIDFDKLQNMGRYGRVLVSDNYSSQIVNKILSNLIVETL